MSNKTKKRIFDLVVTLLSMVVWLPVLLVCAIAILFSEGRPVFYVSRRCVGDQVCKVVKYRTMVRNADKIYNRHTVPISNNTRFLNVPGDSPLYTPIGRVIEKFGITELPQFVHVIQGYMSLIGNRPLPVEVLREIDFEYPGAADRFLTPAGLTGPVQLVGKADLFDRQRLMLEMTYCHVAEHGYSWKLDFLILWYTVLIVLHIRPAMSVDEAKEMIVKLSCKPFSYPIKLRRRAFDAGESREVVWDEKDRYVADSGSPDYDKSATKDNLKKYHR